MDEVRTIFDLPGFAEALQRQRIVRTAVYLQRTEKILNFTVTPMTLRQYTILRFIGSPLLPPFGTPQPEDLAAFLWILQPDWSTNPRARDRFVKKHCRAFNWKTPKPIFQTKRALAKWRKHNGRALFMAARLTIAIRQYVNDTLQDRQAGGTTDLPDYYSDQTGICAALGRHFSHFRSEEEILNLPMKKIFQYLKNIHEHTALEHGHAPLMDNPVDELVDKYLEKVNTQN